MNWKKKYGEFEKSNSEWCARIVNKIEMELCETDFIWFHLTQATTDGVELAVDKLIKKHKKPEVSDTERRLKTLECEHVWEYESDVGRSMVSFMSGFDYDYRKVCQCGKVIQMGHEEWLQEQADMHYKKHCECIDGLNELNEEE